MTYQNIILEKRDGIGKVTLNRPEVQNRINQGIYQEMKAAIEDIRQDDDVRVVIITGAGDEAFCWGADIAGLMTSNYVTPLLFREVIRKGQELMSLIENLEKPVIAMVNGSAIYGGCELTYACDFVIASEKVIFQQQEILGGTLPGWGGTQRLPRLVGLRKAKELVMLGEPITAPEAEEIGLIDRAVPPEMLEAEVMELANKLKGKTPLALEMAKEALRMGVNVDLASGLIFEAEAEVVCMTTENRAEARKARAEGRAPLFKKERRIIPGKEWR